MPIHPDFPVSMPFPDDDRRDMGMATVENQSRVSEVTATLSGYVATTIETNSGTFEVLARPMSDEGSVNQPWSLNVSGGNISVNTGVVKRYFSFDRSSRLAIENADEEFSPSAGRFIALTAEAAELAPHILDTFVLGVVSDWSAFPSPWDFGTTGSDGGTRYQLTRVVWPLYYIFGNGAIDQFEADRVTTISEDLSAYRMCANTDFFLDWRAVRPDVGAPARILCPILTPGQGALPIDI